MQNFPSTSNSVLSEIIEITENYSPITDVKIVDEDQDKELLEKGNKNKSEILNNKENSTFNICELS